MLSVGFGSGGPAMVSGGQPQAARHSVSARPKPSLAVARLNPTPPTVQVSLSGPPSEATATTARVPVAPPLARDGYYAPNGPNDAAAVAWRLHAAPTAPAIPKALVGGKYGRSVGGLAPPFLPVPVSQLKRA